MNFMLVFDLITIIIYSMQCSLFNYNDRARSVYIKTTVFYILSIIFWPRVFDFIWSLDNGTQCSIIPKCPNDSQGCNQQHDEDAEDAWAAHPVCRLQCPIEGPLQQP